MARPPIASTSCATATLDTVARPRGLSGMRNAPATLASTPIWWRTWRRSGLVAGSISQMISKSVIGSRRPANGRRVHGLGVLADGPDAACDGQHAGGRLLDPPERD